MLGNAPPTTSNLNLVNSEVSDTTAAADALDGINMADLVESLDTRELDIGEGEEIDYDGSCLGVISTSFLPRTKMIPKRPTNNLIIIQIQTHCRWGHFKHNKSEEYLAKFVTVLLGLYPGFLGSVGKLEGSSQTSQAKGKGAHIVCHCRILTKNTQGNT